MNSSLRESRVDRVDRDHETSQMRVRVSIVDDCNEYFGGF